MRFREIGNLGVAVLIAEDVPSLKMDQTAWLYAIGCVSAIFSGITMLSTIVF